MTAGKNATCFRCHRKWRCPSTRNPRWSWCDQCRDEIENNMQGHRWQIGMPLSIAGGISDGEDKESS